MDRAELHERKVVVRLGYWIATSQELTKRTTTRFSTVPGTLQCLHIGTSGSEHQCLDLNAYTRRPPIYLQPVTPTQQSLPSRNSWQTYHNGTWCQKTGFEINPNKVQAPRCTPNNKAVAGQATPAVSFNGEVMESTNSFRYFKGMFTYKIQVDSTKPSCRKGLLALKAIAVKKHPAVLSVPAVSE